MKHICKYCGEEILDGQAYGRHVLKCKRNQINYSIELTEKQKQLIYGSMLGDMYMSYASKKYSKLPLIDVIHGIEQRAYAMWKYEILKNIVKMNPKKAKYIQNDTINITIELGFTQCHWHHSYRYMTLPTVKVSDIFRVNGCHILTIRYQ